MAKPYHPHILTKSERAKGGKNLQKLLAKNPKLNKKRIKGINQAYKNPKYRAKLKRIKKIAYQDPKLRKKIDISVTKWYKEHPNIAKRNIRRLKQYFLSHRKEYQNKFENGKNNPFKPHIKTRLGLVRSKPEAEIANFLKKNNISAGYESKTLILDGYVCVPDFYLPEYKTYIEYYGGYPSSRNKKILKNKLYKKHKIKCIFITPSELYDLDMEILGKIK